MRLNNTPTVNRDGKSARRNDRKGRIFDLDATRSRVVILLVVVLAFDSFNPRGRREEHRCYLHEKRIVDSLRTSLLVDARDVSRCVLFVRSRANERANRNDVRARARGLLSGFAAVARARELFGRYCGFTARYSRDLVSMPR